MPWSPRWQSKSWTYASAQRRSREARGQGASPTCEACEGKHLTGVQIGLIRQLIVRGTGRVLAEAMLALKDIECNEYVVTQLTAASFTTPIQKCMLLKASVHPAKFYMKA